MDNNIASARVLEATARRRRAGPLVDFIRRLLRVRLAGFGLFVIVFFTAVAVLAPWIAPYDPVQQEVTRGLEPPTLDHFMGTDLYGRDVMSRLMYGSRVSLQVGLTAMGLAIVLGTPLGLLSGFRGGWVDAVIMRTMDGIYAFPSLMLALSIVAMLGPGALQVTAALGIVSVPLFSRLVRASVLSIRELDYVMAAKAIGAGELRILVSHIFPNTTAPIIVQGTMGLAWAVLAEASLSFLGLGVPLPTPTWGIMLNDGFQYLTTDAWLSIFPGLAIFVLVLSFNFIGDALRDVLDPKLGRALGLR